MVWNDTQVSWWKESGMAWFLLESLAHNNRDRPLHRPSPPREGGGEVWRVLGPRAGPGDHVTAATTEPTEMGPEMRQKRSDQPHPSADPMVLLSTSESPSLPLNRIHVKVKTSLHASFSGAPVTSLPVLHPPPCSSTSLPLAASCTARPPLPRWALHPIANGALSSKRRGSKGSPSCKTVDARPIIKLCFFCSFEKLLSATHSGRWAGAAPIHADTWEGWVMCVSAEAAGCNHQLQWFWSPEK